MCDDSEALYGEPVSLWQLSNFGHWINYFRSIILFYYMATIVRALFFFFLKILIYLLQRHMQTILSYMTI